jgi:hypothetical protein
MNSVKSFGLTLALLAAPAAQAGWMPTVNWQNGLKATAGAAVLAATYLAYKRGYVGAAVDYVVDTVTRHKLATAVIVGAATTLAAAKYLGYLDNVFTTGLPKVPATPATEVVVVPVVPATTSSANTGVPAVTATPVVTEVVVVAGK